MSSARRKWIAGFYWIGVALAVACVAVVVAGHMERFSVIERIDFPLSWAFAGMAGVAFLAAELCHSIASRPPSETPRNVAAKSKN
jgi:type IV secretory pathway VirB2 component (pilin)